MFNFVEIVMVETKKNKIVIEPRFKIGIKDSDLMVRGSDFYAVYDNESGLWVKDEDFVTERIDRDVAEYYETCEKKDGYIYTPLYMRHSDSGIIDKFHKYCQKQLRDNYVELDSRLTFLDDVVDKKKYISKKLPYNMYEGETPCWDELTNTLYHKEELDKIKWAYGSVFTGDSKKNDRFLVLYGEPGTGKSTILNVGQQLFDGYWNVFDAKSIGAAKDFALESFKSNPLISIQHDGDLSRIEDNTMLNSIVSHETMEINEKHKTKYSMKFDTILLMGTNKPVKITDAKSGIIRRLLDVYPSGNKVPKNRYLELVEGIKFELGAIAYQCKERYLELGPNYYDDYIPVRMLSETNDFYDFVEYYYDDFANAEYVTLQDVWTMYQAYCDMAKVRFPLNRKKVAIEIGNYFNDFKANYYPDNKHIRNAYFGFRFSKFMKDYTENVPKITEKTSWLKFDKQKSILDEVCKDCPAQLATESGTPKTKWSEVTTTLKDIDTSKLHYLKLPNPTKESAHIFIDFDLKDENGKKSLEKNIEAASKFPETYAELSKSGCGIHLHYIYDGDASKLSAVYDDNIEVKVCNGNSSDRRMLTKCNDKPIAHISSGLPFRKEEKKVIDEKVFANEKAIRRMIVKALNKEVHADTSSNIDFIYWILDQAYKKKGFIYDVSDMYQAVLYFASCSTNQAQRCLKKVAQMHFKSEEDPVADISKEVDKKIVFFDVEVFPNLFLINWKFRGKEQKCKRMINPSPREVASLFNYRLIGFNNRRYDNHMLYARAQGYSIEELYKLSKRIVSANKGVANNYLFANAYNLSYADVYDYTSAHRQSLKKWEIELHIHHKELGYDWNQPVPEDKWLEVAEYCDNDVYATEAVFDHTQAEFMARKLLAVISKLSVNNTDNQHSAKILFGENVNDKTEAYKQEFVYTDLSIEFPGYTFDHGKSSYMGEDPSEGGYAWSKPGIYYDVWVFDVASMHPHSAIALNIFGDRFTKRYKEIVDLRVAIKHGDIEKARTMFDGVLAPYLQDTTYLKDIAQALKIVINAVYGNTSAPFNNPFKDSRNVDNIVAKRGALFMITLKHALIDKGIEVIHCKTDSIKVPSPSEETKKFIMDFGKKYGYTFEVENVYEKMCIINKADYIAKYAEPHIDKETGKEIFWSATGAQFKEPYVFKTLFSKEAIDFYDVCETREAKKSALYLDFDETNPSNPTFIGKVGLFTPIKSGYGGARLVTQATAKDGSIKYDSVQKTKGYRWVESETIDKKHYKDIVDLSYYAEHVDAMKAEINKYGDVEEFIA